MGPRHDPPGSNLLSECDLPGLGPALHFRHARYDDGGKGRRRPVPCSMRTSVDPHLTAQGAGSRTVLIRGTHRQSDGGHAAGQCPRHAKCQSSRRGRHHGRTGIGATMIPGFPDPHLSQIRPVRVRTPEGCEECLALGTPWVHLRLCLSCGHVGCCDASPMRHARAHASALHPIVRSLEPGEEWRWCYPHEAFV
jgi:hypothetical protein